MAILGKWSPKDAAFSQTPGLQVKGQQGVPGKAGPAGPKGSTGAQGQKGQKGEMSGKKVFFDGELCLHEKEGEFLIFPRRAQTRVILQCPSIATVLPFSLC